MVHSGPVDQPPRSLAELGTWLPAYAADASRNLTTVLGTPGEHLTAAQHWACVLAAASTMAGNAVYFRARHFLHGSYDDLRAGLRSSATLTPSTDRAGVELCCVVVAAIHGCEACLQEHEAGARGAGVSREAVNDALRIAAVVASIAATLDSDRLVTD